MLSYRVRHYENSSMKHWGVGWGGGRGGVFLVFSEVLEMSSEVAGPGPTHGRSNLLVLTWDLLLVCRDYQHTVPELAHLALHPGRPLSQRVAATPLRADGQRAGAPVPPAAARLRREPRGLHPLDVCTRAPLRARASRCPTWPTARGSLLRCARGSRCRCGRG